MGRNTVKKDYLTFKYLSIRSLAKMLFHRWDLLRIQLYAHLVSLLPRSARNIMQTENMSIPI